MDNMIDAAFPQWFVLAQRAKLTPAIVLLIAWAEKSGQKPVDLQRELDVGMRVLEEWPIDTIQWPVVNSDRWDVQTDPEYGHGAHAQLRHPLPRDEICAFKWSHAAFQIDGCSGRTAANPKDFLEAYWAARYHKLIVD